MSSRTLWCEAGKHEWERPAQRGRLPLSCSQHKISVPARKGGREEALKRAQKAKQEKFDREVWDEVKRYRTQHPSCSCELHRGMDLLELRVLGSGCCTRWICPVLDFYRRRVS